MKQIYYLILICFFLLGCNNKDLQQINSQKTAELIHQILTDSTDNYSNANCLTEKFRFHSTIPPGVNFDNYMKSELGIENLDHLDEQFVYFKEFKINSQLAQSRTIITAKEFDDFEKKADKGDYHFWDWLEKTCDNGYVSISRPIFNEDFTKAIIIIANVSCPQCGGGETRLYEYKNGRWEIIETTFEWIS